jgi:hypothetical protein
MSASLFNCKPYALQLKDWSKIIRHLRPNGFESEEDARQFILDYPEFKGVLAPAAEETAATVFFWYPTADNPECYHWARLITHSTYSWAANPGYLPRIYLYESEAALRAHLEQEYRVPCEMRPIPFKLLKVC